MRRLTLSVVLFLLTGVLVAQTPQSAPLSMPLTTPNKFNGTLFWSSSESSGDTIRFKGARLEFALGVTITADEIVYEKAKNGTLQLAGNVQLVLRKN